MIASVLRLSRDEFISIRKENRNVFDAYTVHKLIYSLFPKEGEENRSFLFCDKGGNALEKRFLILSKKEPLQPEIGQVESKTIPESFLGYNYYTFEVQVNPVKKDSKTGKIIPVKGRDALSEWFYKKAPSLGFNILPDTLLVGDTNIVQFEKEGKKITYGKAVFSGRLEVTDRQLFIKSFENGIGKGKAFGFGLFQIVPITE